MAAVAAALVATGYVVGRTSVDTHSGEIADLQSEVKAVEAKQGAAEGELEIAETEAETAKAEAAETHEELAAERSFKGKGGTEQVADQEYETDFPWGAAGRAGDFIFKPVGWTQDGEKWLLTVEAKNVSHEPKEPFCGGAESVVIDAGQNQYTGESVLGTGGGADCAGELQPGTTDSYEAEFKIPSHTVPVVVAIYGEYAQEEEAKTWELPRE